jgi:hypothetical protein
MRLLSRALPAAMMAAAALSLCGTAEAANVVVGPTLAGPGWESEECGAPTCTLANYELAGTGPTLTSPVSGAIVRFSVLGGSTAGTYRIRTVRPGETSVSWFFGKEAPPVAAVPNAGVQGYPVSLPITAGETIGLTLSETASAGVMEGVGRSTFWEIEPPESGHYLGISEPGLFAFDAEVQPAPMIASLGTTSGPTSGGTAVTITGTDLENVTGVSFGGAAAASFTGNSESQITAVAPASAGAASVSVSVTTVAGKAVATQAYKYEAPPAPAPMPAPAATPAHCVVPNLTGKKLQAAKKALVNAKCTLGAVKKLGGATAKSGKVAKQGSKPKSRLAAGSKIAVTLKPAKPATKKHGKK